MRGTMSGSESSDSESETSSTPLTETPKWDQFRNVPPPVDAGSAVKNKWWIRGERLVKVLAYIFSFIIVLVSATVAKTSMFLMIKQISLSSSNLPFCNEGKRGMQYIDDTTGKDWEVDFNEGTEKEKDERVLERVAWIWAICFAFCVPQVMSLGRTLRKCLFKFNNSPKKRDIVFIAVMELLHTAGLAILCFVVLPELDTANALVLSSLIATVPCCVLLLSRFKKTDNAKRFLWRSMPLDTLALMVQLSGCVMFPVLQVAGINNNVLPTHPYPWAIPVGLIMTSCGWWETFTEEDSYFPLGKALWNVKKRMIEHHGSRFIAYSIIIPFKIGAFLGCMVLFTYTTGAIRKSSDLTILFEGSFGEHSYRVVEVISEQIKETTESFSDGYVPKVTAIRTDPTPHAVYVLLVQIFTSLLAYWSAKFAAKVCIQSVGFSLPLTCVTPFSIVIVMTMCGAKAFDKV